ncbi:MAG: hypothetical protein R3C05_24065 [Pirellulaceae bacterium]
MIKRISSPGKAVPWLIVAVLTSLMWTNNAADAYDPFHPEVDRMVKRGIAYLRTPSKEHSHHELGSKMLFGYAVYKVDHDPNDPLVQAGRSSGT